MNSLIIPFQHVNPHKQHAGGVCAGLARTIYIRCVYGSFGGEFTIYTVMYVVYIRFWPTLCMWLTPRRGYCLLSTRRTSKRLCSTLLFEASAGCPTSSVLVVCVGHFRVPIKVLVSISSAPAIPVFYVDALHFQTGGYMRAHTKVLASCLGV